MAGTNRNPWVLTPQPRPGAALRLICLPHAGGGAAAYRDWPGCFSSDVEVNLVQLPGRENRMFDTPHSRMDTLVPALAEHLGSLTAGRYALFGHSMGALVAFELSRYLGADRRPEVLIVSGHHAPHLERTGPHRHALSESELVDALRELGGLSPEVLDNPEYLKLVLPTVRADLAVVEEYAWPGGEPLTHDLVALGGAGDRMVPAEDLRAWERHTTARFSHRIFPGGHFYLQDQLVDVIDEVRRALVPANQRAAR
ncbi:thioesterase II family protein [Amycolatopsis lurida]